MDKNRMWVIGSMLGMVVVLVLGWIVGVGPQLAATADADEQRAGVEQTNTLHEAALVKLKEEFAGIDALEAELAPLTASVPPGTDAPAFLNQLDALATTHGVTLTAFTLGVPEAYTPMVAAPVTTETPTESDATSDAAPLQATPEPAPIAGAPPTTNSQITAANFASLAVSITVSGGDANVLNFVEGLQSGTRLFMMTGLNTAAVTAGSAEVTATISGLIYSLVMAETPTEVGAG